MKNIIIIVLLLLLSNFVSGQNNSANVENLPVVVDNSKFFPPVGNQFYNSCQIYSLAYLKSYIWNREYNRDPKLLKNQFNPWYVWNSDVTPLHHYTFNEIAITFLQSQGCATKDVFAATGEDQEILPTLAERESALSYRSKSMLIKTSPDIRNENSMKQYLNELKDSLNKGVCFTIYFPIYKAFHEMYTGHDFIYNYENYTAIGMTGSHLAAVVGYNDTIMTKSGSRGALKIINSYGPLFGDKGYFYLDYKWLLKMTSWTFEAFFLQEDFSHVPTSYLSLDLSGAITGEDIEEARNLFIDRTYQYPNYPGAEFDYLDFNIYLSKVPLVVINKVNDKKVNEIVYINNHNHDGNHKTLTDLTDYVKSADFQSVEVIMNDPVSATYIGDDNQVLFSYSREAKAEVANSIVKFIGTKKYIVGKVQDLTDTTIVVKNFFSQIVGYALTPKVGQTFFINSCTSVLKRKLITFSISDIQEEDVAPTFIDSVSAFSTYTNQTLFYKFQAKDNHGNPITFSLEDSIPEASISRDGELKFKSAKIGTYKFKVVASNKIAASTLPVSVKVDLSDAVEDIEVPETSVKIFPNPIVNNASIEFLLTKEETVKTVIYDYLGRQMQVIANKIYYAGDNTIDYDATNLISGVYIIKFQAGSFSKSIKVVKH